MIWGKKGVSLPHHVSVLWFSPHLPICLGQGTTHQWGCQGTQQRRVGTRRNQCRDLGTQKRGRISNPHRGHQHLLKISPVPAIFTHSSFRPQRAPSRPLTTPLYRKENRLAGSSGACCVHRITVPSPSKDSPHPNP